MGQVIAAVTVAVAGESLLVFTGFAATLDIPSKFLTLDLSLIYGDLRIDICTFIK